jgi:hypothetical protein
LLPAPRLTCTPLVRAVVKVMVSAPVPPVMVVVLLTEAVLVKLPKRTVLLPAPRSIDPCQRNVRMSPRCAT